MLINFPNLWFFALIVICSFTNNLYFRMFWSLRCHYLKLGLLLGLIKQVLFSSALFGSTWTEEYTDCFAYTWFLPTVKSYYGNLLIFSCTLLQWCSLQRKCVRSVYALWVHYTGLLKTGEVFWWGKGASDACVEISSQPPPCPLSRYVLHASESVWQCSETNWNHSYQQIW